MTGTSTASFDQLALSLDLAFVVNAASTCPDELGKLLQAKLRLVAKRVARSVPLDVAIAHDAVARAVGFTSAAALDQYLSPGSRRIGEPATLQSCSKSMSVESSPGDRQIWRESLVRCVVILAEPPTGQRLSAEHVEAFEAFAAALSVHTGLAASTILDSVCARQCACTQWIDALHGHSPSPQWRPTLN